MTMAENQTQTQVKVKKMVEDAKIIEVPKWIYNTLRSFTESSSKPEYPWNNGIRVGNRICFIKPGKWQFIVYTNVNDTNDPDTVPAIAELIGRNGIVMTVYKTFMYVGNEKIPLNETYKYAIVPNTDVPFSIPILLDDVITKVREYVEW